MSYPILVDLKDGKVTLLLKPLTPVRLKPTEALQLRDDLDVALHELAEDREL